MRTIKLTKVISSAGYAVSIILLVAFSVGSTASPAQNPDIRASKPALTVEGSYVEAAAFSPPASFYVPAVAIWQDKESGKYWSVVGSTTEDNNSGAAYIYSKMPGAGGWHQEARLIGGDVREGDDFGSAVAIENQTVAVTSYAANPLLSTGGVYVFVRDAVSGDWVQQKKLSTGGTTEFGWTISLSGDNLAVAEPGNDHVYIYDRAGGAWDLSQRLDPPTFSRTGTFGESMQLSGDSIVIGDKFESEFATNEGVAYIYTRNPGGSFSGPTTLHAPSPAAKEYFGGAVALNGSVAVIGAPGRNDYVGGADTFAYDEMSKTWNFVSTIAPSDPPFAQFGMSLSLDSDTLAVGEPFAPDLGAVFVYVSTADPDYWRPQASLTGVHGCGIGISTALAGDEILSGGACAKTAVGDFYRKDGAWYEQPYATGDNGEKFGTAVSISGNVVVITAPVTPHDDEVSVATIYTKDPTGHWNWTKELPDPEAGYESIGFHSCSPVITDGNRIFIGILDENSSQGAVHVYVNDADSWVEETTLVASDGAAGDFFGCSISTSADHVLIGAPGRNHYQGAGYTFSVETGSWSEESTLTSTDGAANDYLGESAFLSGDTAVLGAPFRNGSSGTAFVFLHSAGTWTQSGNLSAKDVATGDEFGATVAIAGDSVIVGSPNKTVSMNAGAGGAYVFRQSGGSWVEQEKFEGDSANAFLGSSIAASTSRMIIGVPGANAVQIYDDTSGSWELYSTVGGSYSTSSFGAAVGISSTTIIVGAPTTGAHDGGEAFILTDSDVVFSASFE